MSEITCPSGLKLRVRGLKGKELVILQDKQAHRSGTFVDRIFNACVEEVLDGGIYNTEPGKNVNWDNVLVGDRYSVLLAIRSETFGADYDFSVKCKACDHKFKWNVRIDELQVKTLAPEDAQAFASNQPMTAVFDGKVVTFRLATGKDEKAAAQHKSVDNAMVTMLARKILSIEDVQVVRPYLENLGLASLIKMQREFQRRDCGVETAIEVQCPECEDEMEVELPLGKNFWIPEETPTR